MDMLIVNEVGKDLQVWSSLIPSPAKEVHPGVHPPCPSANEMYGAWAKCTTPLRHALDMHAYAQNIQGPFVYLCIGPIFQAQ